MTRQAFLVLLGITLWAVSAHASDRCRHIIQRLEMEEDAADVVCFESHDLTTNNVRPPPEGPTTPEDNSLPGLPPFAFTPRVDRSVISPTDHTPIDGPVPGIQVQGRFGDDPTGEARFLVRLPNRWNGKLVVAGASGTRSEFNGDFAWSDFVVQKGYAYASQNKGVLNFFLSDAMDPLACRLNPSSTTFVHFYDNDPDKPFTQWQEFIVRGAELAREAVKARYGTDPHRTYAVGTSNGGYQVRRAIELAPNLFDGGVDWEGTFVDPGTNILIDLPPAIRNLQRYVDSGLDPDSVFARAIRHAGYPPDLPRSNVSPLSLWERYTASFWEVTMCQWQKRLDETYDTYVAGLGNYNYFERPADVADRLEEFETTGRIRRPLITVAGTMDGLLPISRHARAYASKVAASHHHRRAPYRLYEVQNGNHIETYKDFYPQLELIQPHAQRAFDLLVDHVERGGELPADQCVPRGGSISGEPEQPGRCEELLVEDD